MKDIPTSGGKNINLGGPVGDVESEKFGRSIGDRFGETLGGLPVVCPNCSKVYSAEKAKGLEECTVCGGSLKEEQGVDAMLAVPAAPSIPKPPKPGN